MKSKKDLEETLKDKVTPLLEETMEKSWGLTIPKLESDITDRLKNPYLNIYLPFQLTFHKAKKVFKKEFLKRELRLHLGNVSQLAKGLGIDRRSIHRAIKQLDIDVAELRLQIESTEEYYKQLIDRTIRRTLQDYHEIIQPEKMEKMYQEVPSLSRHIAKVLHHQDLSWKEAEREFERQFLEHALQEAGTIAKTAKKIGIRSETLQRKVKKLGLR